MKKLLGSIILFFIIAVSVIYSSSYYKAEQSSSNGITYSEANTDRKAYSSIGALKRDSDIVVKGTIKRKLDSYNLNRNANSEIIILGTDYEFEVKNYLKGSGDKIIVVTQEGGQTSNLIQNFSDRTEMDINGNYILFLNKVPDMDKYMFGGNPYKFKVSQGKVMVDAGDFKAAFDEQSETDFINELELE